MVKAIVVVVVLGALLSGCGGKVIVAGKAEGFVRDSLGQPVQSVKCPGGVNAKVGNTFDCKVTTQSGAKETVTVDITSIQGTTVGLRITGIHAGG